MQKRSEKNVLRSVVRSYGGSGRKPPVRVVKDELGVLEPESRGFNPYANTPPPADEVELEARIRLRRSVRKSSS